MYWRRLRCMLCSGKRRDDFFHADRHRFSLASIDVGGVKANRFTSGGRALIAIRPIGHGGGVDRAAAVCIQLTKLKEPKIGLDRFEGLWAAFGACLHEHFHGVSVKGARKKCFGNISCKTPANTLYPLRPGRGPKLKIVASFGVIPERESYRARRPDGMNGRQFKRWP